MFNIGLSY